jgi:UDP-glucose 4-epimerase
MRVTITGGVGNLAEYVIKELEGEHELLLFDRLRPGEGRYPYKTDHPFLQGDLTSFEDCQKAVEQADAVIHLGAIKYATDPPDYAERARQRGRTPLPFDETMRVNTMGTWYLLEAARRANVRTVVAATTNVVMGFDFMAENPSCIDYLPIDEEHPIYPTYSYGLSKRFNEETMLAFTRTYGLRTYALRPAMICRAERMRNLAETIKPVTEWDLGLWGYEDIRDMARAFRMCLEAAEEMPPHAVFYINAADTRAYEDSIELIRRARPQLLDKPISLEGRQSLISTAKAKRFFGWEAEHSWMEFLDEA